MRNFIERLIHSGGIPYFIIGAIMLYYSFRLLKITKAQGKKPEWGKAFLAVTAVLLVLFVLSRFSNP